MRKPSTLKPPAQPIKRVQTWQTESGTDGWGQGRAAGWKLTRLRILKRDGGLCQCHDCRTLGRYEIAHMVDHIDNRRGPGYEDDRNLAAINRQCHARKTQLEALIGRRLAKRPPWMDRTTWMG
jgi:5-methylcytosine-specific restriction protein A